MLGIAAERRRAMPSSTAMAADANCRLRRTGESTQRPAPPGKAWSHHGGMPASMDEMFDLRREVIGETGVGSACTRSDECTIRRVGCRPALVRFALHFSWENLQAFSTARCSGSPARCADANASPTHGRRAVLSISYGAVGDRRIARDPWVTVVKLHVPATDLTWVRSPSCHATTGDDRAS